MKKLIFNTLLVLSIVSCSSNDNEIPTPVSKNGTMTYTYAGKSYTSDIQTASSDQTKAVAGWSYDAKFDAFVLVFNSGNFNGEISHQNTHGIVLNHSEKNNINGMSFTSGGKNVALKNIKIKITFNDGTSASGEFTSDVVSGNFTKIKKG